MFGKNSSRWYIVKMALEVTSPPTGAVPDWGYFDGKFMKLKECLIIYRIFSFLLIYSLTTFLLYPASRINFLSPKGTSRAQNFHPKKLKCGIFIKFFKHLYIKMNFMVTDGLI